MPKADEGSIDRRPRLDTGDRPGETWREDGANLRLTNSPGDTRAHRRYGGAPEGDQEDREDTEEAMARTPQSIPAASASDLRGGVDLVRRHRLIISLVVGACLGFTYLAINELSSRLSYDFNVATSYDFRIPFVPEWVWIYNLNIPMPLTLILVVKHADRLLEVAGGFFAIFLVAGLMFVAFSVHADVLRPDLSVHASSASLAMVASYYAVDGVGNCLPSLHVAYSVYAGWWGLILMPRWIGVPYALLGVAITLSTMFVKQHFIADVVTAIVLAAVVFGAQVVWGVSMRRFVPKPIMRLVLRFRRTSSS